LNDKRLKGIHSVFLLTLLTPFFVDRIDLANCGISAYHGGLNIDGDVLKMCIEGIIESSGLVATSVRAVARPPSCL
jgi:hypothetical protein